MLCTPGGSPVRTRERTGGERDLLGASALHMQGFRDFVENAQGGCPGLAEFKPDACHAR